MDLEQRVVVRKGDPSEHVTLLTELQRCDWTMLTPEGATTAYYTSCSSEWEWPLCQRHL